MDLEIRIVKRYWSRVDRSGGPDACWLWTAAKNSFGYGQIRTATKLLLAHRIAVYLDGRDPEGFCVCHLCDNPSCVNPKHLWLGTQADNINDMRRKGRHNDANKERGSKRYNAILHQVDVIRILRLRSEGLTVNEISSELAIHKASVENVVGGRSWKHVDRTPYNLKPGRIRITVPRRTALTENQVREIKHLLRQGHFQRAIARQFGVTQAAISAISTGKTWKHID